MIKLTNLSKYYQSGTTVTLGLRKINLSLSCNEFVVITGESGSGKTTLLSTISGLLPYEEGELYFSGIPTSHYDASDWEQYRKEHIAFIFQNYNLIDSYTALENVMTSLLIQGMCPAKAKQTAMHYLERVGIAAYASHHASELSSGQKQRLSIARALAKNTKIIVADEPTGNLDVENGKQIMQLLSELATDKLVLVVTHNYEEAAPFATRKIRMYDGEIVEDTVLSSKQPLSEIKADCPTNVFPKNTRQIARIFTKMDIFSRKKRSLLLTTLLFFTAAASFLFFGNFLANSKHRKKIQCRNQRCKQQRIADIHNFKSDKHNQNQNQHNFKLCLKIPANCLFDAIHYHPVIVYHRLRHNFHKLYRDVVTLSGQKIRCQNRNDYYKHKLYYATNIVSCNCDGRKLNPCKKALRPDRKAFP